MPPVRDRRSQKLFERANTLFPGGVNSPVRAFRAVGGTPRFIVGGKGSRLIDADGNRLIDYVLAWGPLIAGHAHPTVVRAIRETASRGTAFGAPTPLEIELAAAIRKAVPSVERIRMVNSGTEATMSAIRVARAHTGRSRLLKFEGCYHGHADHLLIRAGSGATTLGVPDSPGVPAAFAGLTLTAPYNDATAARKIIDGEPDLACVIVEPVAANMGVVLPEKGFLEMLREATAARGVVLIFDEVLTGFRAAWGGAQSLYGITPDLTCLGKVIGGGLPVGAYGGRREIMERVSPAGPVYQAGTLSGNPIAMAAGLATLQAVGPAAFRRLEGTARRLREGLAEAADRARVPVWTTQVGSIVGLFFHPGPVRNHAAAKQSDTQRYARFFHGMLDRGVYLPPAQFEALFVSTAHTADDIKQTIVAAREVFAEI